jgi:hypothetical protein
MTENRCHCKKPATWFARIVATREVTIVEGRLPEVVLGTYGIDSWAACDEHLAEASRSLIERNDMENNVLVLRQEGE